MFDLRLVGAALAVCGASSPEDQKLIEQVLDTLPPNDEADGFARAFLAAKGLSGIGALFDALGDVAAAANDQAPSPSNDFTSPLLARFEGGLIHAAH
jgi:type IV secretion system protein TrbE